jgi:hypothetical protein
MAFEDDALERAYPYCTGWKVAGCLALLFALVGAAGTMVVPVCCDQWRNGKNAGFAVLAVVGTPCTMIAILFAVVAFSTAVRDAVRPALLRVTPVALLLPDAARGQALEKDEQGNPKPDSPLTHPEEIPFSAIRWIRREAGTSPGNDRLLVVHSLSPATLELQQNMMQDADFEELEVVLRAAVPEAFVALPVPSAPPPTEPPPTDDV